MDIEEKFIAKSRKFRVHFKLTEDDIDSLLASKSLKYKGLELGTKTLTLELAEAYPLIYGIDYCDFKKIETTFPKLSELPPTTQNYINNRPEGAGNTVGLKGSKNMASHVIIAIKDYPVGHDFLNFEVLKTLPPPLNEQTTITWTTGLLMNLVKSTKKSETYIDATGKTRRGMIYTIVKKVSPKLLKKAQEKIEKE